VKFIAIIFLTLCQLNSATAGTLAQFRTVFGDIEVELFDKEKPVTVENFKRYVNAGLYQNMFFHRWVPEFVVQGGGFVAQDAGTTNVSIGPIPTFGTITNETKFGPLISNIYGTIAMARGTDANSASSQFYFNVADNSSLDTSGGVGYAVFGKTISGTSVLNRFVTLGNGVYHYRFAGAFSDLPTITTNSPEFNNFKELVYVDVSLLNVHVRNARGARQISWNSATGLVNHVEFTTNFPPQWKTLVATNGTGSDITVVDPTPTNEFRFYRVTVGQQ